MAEEGPSLPGLACLPARLCSPAQGARLALSQSPDPRSVPWLPLGLPLGTRRARAGRWGLRHSCFLPPARGAHGTSPSRHLLSAPWLWAQPHLSAWLISVPLALPVRLSPGPSPCLCSRIFLSFSSTFVQLCSLLLFPPPLSLSLLHSVCISLSSPSLISEPCFHFSISLVTCQLDCL